jgi:hypothetical protein
LQRWLQINSEQVPSLTPDRATRLAIWCCDPSTFYDRPDFQHHIRSTSLSDVIEELSIARAKGVERIVISSEYYFLARPTVIAKIFADLKLTVEKVVCFVRRQDRIIASGYAQDVKALRRADRLEISPGGYTSWYDWALQQQSYQSALPDATFVPLEFDHLRHSGKLLDRWKLALDCAVTTVDSLPDGELVNPSLPGELVEMCRAANEIGDFGLSEWALDAVQRGIAVSPYRLPEAMQIELRDGFSASNDEFVSAIDDSACFEDYTSAHWEIVEGSPVTLCPSFVAKLLSQRSTSLAELT